MRSDVQHAIVGQLSQALAHLEAAQRLILENPTPEEQDSGEHHGYSGLTLSGTRKAIDFARSAREYADQIPTP